MNPVYAIDIARFIDQGVFVLDEQSQVTLWNPWLERHSGIAADEAVGKTLPELFPDIDKRSAYDRVTHALRTRSALVLATGLHQYLLPFSASPSQRQQGINYMQQFVRGQVISHDSGDRVLLIYIQDVTENVLLNNTVRDTVKQLRANSQKLEEARKLLEEEARTFDEQSQYKSQFLANMSHELRTPLNSLMILASLLMENETGNLTDEQVQFATLVHRAGGELLRLINEVLDLAKIEAGMMTINNDRVELAEVAQCIDDSFRHDAETRNVRFEVTIADGVPPIIHTDLARLNQVLRNLVSNAIKFSADRSVTVTITRPDGDVDLAASGLSGPSTIAFKVSDTGVGIDEAKQHVIFEAFQQADGTTSREYGGTGLGLTISRELTKLLGGEIQLTSAVNEGSTFTVYLPEHAGDDERFIDAPSIQADDNEHVAPAIVAIAPLPPCRVLVVDDDRHSTFIMSRILTRHGADVITGKNGIEALERLADTPDIDLLLIDILMPEMDGREAISHIRRMPTYANLPIIVLTAGVMAEEREKCIVAGADDFVAKPVDYRELIELLRQRLTQPAVAAH